MTPEETPDAFEAPAPEPTPDSAPTPDAPTPDAASADAAAPDSPGLTLADLGIELDERADDADADEATAVPVETVADGAADEGDAPEPDATDGIATDSSATDGVAADAGAADAGTDAEEPADGTASDADDAPTGPTFADLGLSTPVLEAIAGLGYESPSQIQAETIPLLLRGRDVVGLAQTGTGKTAAFALPVLDVIETGGSAPQALVLSPTRELALQVSEAFESYASHLGDVRLLPIYGGQSYGPQLAALRRGVDIVVGTPGRIMDHLKKGTLDLSQVRFLVLDEADEMLKMGFAEDVEEILGQTPTEKQVALFSATMPASIRRLSQQYLRDPEEITVKARTTTNANIRQRAVTVAPNQKLDALTRILEVETYDAVIVFVRTRTETEQVAEKLRARGLSAQAINGDIPQAQRERTVGQLRDGDLDVLVATDVAARGLDVERITHVVNYDLPIDREAYVHRIGRTGRAGRTGDAISLVTPRERRHLQNIERTTRQPMETMRLPSVDDINESRLGRFDDAISTALGQTERIAAFRDIIAHYVEHHDVPEADVAAALAVVAQGDEPLLLSADDELEAPPERRPRDRDGRDGDRGPRVERETPEGFAAYRLEVGSRHRAQPGHILGALANEGGLAREQVGHIRVLPYFSIVELPADLPAGTLDRLAETRVSGRLIELKPDAGPGGGGPRRSRDGGGRDRGGYRDRDGGGGRDRDGGRGGWRDRDDRGARGGGGWRDRDDRGDRGGGREDRGGFRDRDGGGRGGYRDDRGGSRDRDDRGWSGGRGGGFRDRDDRRGGGRDGGGRDAGGFRGGGFRGRDDRGSGGRDGGGRDGGGFRGGRDGDDRPRRKPRW